ncbi:stalk domain-containing protein [Paenibacillus thermotolerans]|uniref:stalk domain-containing protein n=1 Tax=Paenibacillus thermotolerans TaxID=3027807 RepID=UPI0023686E1C|nr:MULTISPECIES: stalk domain-containing protein [unclassified Paenibacillus]
MKRILLSLTVLSVGTFGAAGAVLAASPSQGLRGLDGEVLSQVTTYAGNGDFKELNGAALSASFRAPEGIAVASDGTVYISDSINHLIRQIKNGQVTTYAGITLTLDDSGLPEGTLVDGTAKTSVFQKPAGLALDAKGNLYVADAGNHAIRKISANGRVTTIAGDGVLGSQDGKGEKARLFGPQDVAVAEDGTIYVADTLNHLIRKIDTEGNVTTLNAASDRIVEVIPGAVETAGDFKDGALSEAKFNEPTSIALDAKGNLYVSDSGNQLIRYVDLKAGTVSTVAGVVRDNMYESNALYAASGYADGIAEEAEFNYPRGISLTKEGGLVIIDSLNHTVRYLLDGHVTTIAGDNTGEFGETNGIEGYNSFHTPADSAVLPDDRILVVDSLNNVIRTYALYQHPAGLEKDGELHVTFNGALVEFDTKLEMKNYRTMVPVSAVGKAFGYDVVYEKGFITMTKGDTMLELIPGKAEITSKTGDGEPVVTTIDVAPYIKDDRTYVPIRFFSEQFGLDVEWDAATQTVILREKTQ